MLAPLASVVLLFAVIVAALSYLRMEEMDREQDAVQRDVEYTQQRLRLRLLERQEQLMRVARELSYRELDVVEFNARTDSLLNQYPEIQTIAWIDERRRVKALNQATLNIDDDASQSVSPKHQKDTESGFVQARESNQTVYLLQARSADHAPLLQMQTPLSDRAKFGGVLLAEYSLDALHRYGVPTEVSALYAVSLLDANGKLLAGTAIEGRKATSSILPWANDAREYTMPVSPVGENLRLRAQAYRAPQGILGDGLFWLVTALSGLTAWMLIANWRHLQRRTQAQQALVAETNFRRAMENSIVTGMRAMDLQGRITYVNHAFCQMTGWSESELLGQTPPFPHWPETDREQLAKRLQEELSGHITPGGFHVRVKRRDGTIFDARLYVSQLIDALGNHTGWMTSMTDITEPTRIREQLAASHQRFTTVLEALNASISVAPLGSEELLFANKLYRQWFGFDTHGHMRLIAQAGLPSTRTNDESNDDVDSFAGLPTTNLPETDAESNQIYLAALDLWLEVRTRYLSWVDGRIAQMVIATDISSRRRAEEQAEAQAKRAQISSRLITMGEMASSVAHELNQPLTAINNYCNGILARLKSHQLTEEDLQGALEKTAKQAHRAGQIIQRIRSFVKRSEPNRTLSEVPAMVMESIELGSLELRRFNVRLQHSVEGRLPPLLVDPILIEQVLVNLLRNAAESIDAAQRQTSERLVVLHVARGQLDGKAAIEFSVEDTGNGLAPEVQDRLYEAFYSTKADGMGIGLSLCRSIVESHRGRMSAQNIYNQEEVAGCRFTFWIPLPQATGIATETSLPDTATPGKLQ